MTRHYCWSWRLWSPTPSRAGEQATGGLAGSSVRARHYRPHSRTGTRSTLVRYFPVDGSIFIEGDYLIKGVAGRLLWSLLQQTPIRGANRLHESGSTPRPLARAARVPRQLRESPRAVETTPRRTRRPHPHRKDWPWAVPARRRSRTTNRVRSRRQLTPIPAAMS